MYFQIFQNASSKLWYWHLRAANHVIVANGEGYYNKADAQHAINLVMGTSVLTPVYDA